MLTALVLDWFASQSNFYEMHYNKRTDENSLLFNGSYLLRLVFPLGYNFCGLAKAKVRLGHYASVRAMLTRLYLLACRARRSRRSWVRCRSSRSSAAGRSA